LPEIDIHHVLEVAAFFRLLVLLFAAATAEELRENVAKTAPSFARTTAAACPASGRGKIGKIEPAEIHSGMRALSRARTAGSRAGKSILRIEAELIVHLALLRIAQNIVRFLDILEALFGRLIARIQVGMVLTREFAI